MKECFICLNTTSRSWSPETPCACRPILHKKCWREWAIRNNGECIICRNREPIPVFVVVHPMSIIYDAIKLLFLYFFIVLTIMSLRADMFEMIRDEL